MIDNISQKFLGGVPYDPLIFICMPHVDLKQLAETPFVSVLVAAKFGLLNAVSEVASVDVVYVPLELVLSSDLLISVYGELGKEVEYSLVVVCEESGYSVAGCKSLVVGCSTTEVIRLPCIYPSLYVLANPGQ